MSRVKKLPDGWKRTVLDSICDLQAGKFVSASEILETCNSSSYPCYGGNGLRGFVKDYSHSGTFPLIGRQGALCGNINKASGKFYATEHAVVATPNTNIEVEWLYYQLIHANLNKYATGAAQPGLSVKNIKKISFLLPPLPEQKAIAALLSTWDEAIEKTERLIQAKEKLKRGLAQRLLTGKLRFSEFGRPLIEAGGMKVPKGWKKVRLERLGVIESGGTPSTSEPLYWGKGFPWVTPTEITSLNGNRLLKKTARSITREGVASSSARVLPPGSLIVCTRATVGACAINTCEMTTNQGFKSITPSSNTDVVYLYYWFTINTQVLLRLAAGSTFLEVSRKDFSKIKVSLPPLAEQRRISEVLSACDHEIDLLKQLADKYKTQKRGLMQVLLTGKIRLKAKSSKVKTKTPAQAKTESKRKKKTRAKKGVIN